MHRLRARPRAIARLLVLWALCALPARLPAQTLELRFLDVGQGDAVLIRNAGREVLIDTGPTDDVAAHLKRLGVDTLDLLVASHNHSDHIGGADAVLDRIPVKNYLDNGHPATTQIQRRVLDRIRRKKVTYLRATSRTIAIGDARLRIIPAPAIAGLDDGEQNNRSVVVLLERGRFRALLSGDSEVEEQDALLKADQVPDVDVLKAAHHGSRNGVSAAWLARTRPEVVVISVGAGNSYGHPHAEALRLYRSAGSRVLRTDQQGDVVIRVGPDGRYVVRTERAPRPAAATAPR